MLTSEYAQTEIERLWREGKQPTPAEILLLNHLGLRIETPTSNSRLSAGVRVGNVMLRPWTLAGACWYSQVACRLFHEEDMLEWCLAFALASGDAPEAFETAQDYDGARDAVMGWAMRCGATRRALTHAMTSVAPEIEWPHRPKPPGGKGRKLTPEERVGYLTCATGLPRTYWLSAPLEHVQAVEDGIAMQQQGGDAGGETGQDAMGHFLSVLSQIEKRIAKETADNG